jgi:hypothetical protein
MSEQADSQPQAQQDTAPVQTGGEQQQTNGGGDSPEYVQALMSRMDELAARLPEQSQEPADDGFQLQDLAWNDPSYDDDQGYDDGQQPFDPYAQQQPDPRAELQRLIDAQVQQGVRAQLDPFLIQQQAERLEQQYPDLKKPEVAGQVVKQASQLAQRMGFAQNMSPDQVDRLSRDPAFIEQVYLAQMARSRAAQETPAEADSNGAHIEGAGAQVEQPEVSVQDRILNAGGGSQEGFRWF